MEKSIKWTFCGNKWGPNQWFCSHGESSKFLKKNFFWKKKLFQLICADMIFKIMCGNFYWINWSLDIFVSVLLRYRKFVLYSKITVKPLNSGHLRIFKKLSVNERCPLLGGNLKKIVTFGTECFVHYSWHARYWGCPLLRGSTVLIKLDRQKIKKILPTILKTIISQIISQNFSTIRLNPDELELLEYALVITFLEENF